MQTFEDHWRYITQQRPGVITVQNREELEVVFNLIQGCESYLEVGTAEGNSLYVLSHALTHNAKITYIDYGEKHTTGPRNEVIEQIRARGQTVTEYLGDSNDFDTLKDPQWFDVVFIDAGHDAFNVAIDAMLYGKWATKYIIFHDIQLPEVRRAFEWYARNRPDCKVTRVINSPTFGFGLLEIQ